MALEDGEWSKAGQFFEEVLNQDAECAESYVGTFLSDVRAVNLGQFVQRQIDRMTENVEEETLESAEEEQIRQQWLDEAAEKYYTTGLLSKPQIHALYPQCTTYMSQRKYWEEQKTVAAGFLPNHKRLQRALSFANPQTKAAIRDAFAAWEAAVDQQIAASIQQDTQREQEIIQLSAQIVEGANIRLEKSVQKASVLLDAQYQKLVERQANAHDLWAVRSLKTAFDAMGNYKDCAERAQWCHQRATELGQEAVQRQKLNEQKSQWRVQGLCEHCGGTFGGLFAKKCSKCGKTKEY